MPASWVESQSSGWHTDPLHESAAISRLEFSCGKHTGILTQHSVVRSRTAPRVREVQGIFCCWCSGGGKRPGGPWEGTRCKRGSRDVTHSRSLGVKNWVWPQQTHTLSTIVHDTYWHSPPPPLFSPCTCSSSSPLPLFLFLLLSSFPVPVPPLLSLSLFLLLPSLRSCSCSSSPFPFLPPRWSRSSSNFHVRFLCSRPFHPRLWSLVSPPLDDLIRWESVERRTGENVLINGWSRSVPSRAWR